MSETGATYLPVFSQGESIENNSATSQPREKDPLYAALLGTNIGAAIGDTERETQLDTLDEPKRDSKMVIDKTRMILGLSDPETSLRDCIYLENPFLLILGDLWGPLINSLLLSMLLGTRSTASVSTFTLTFGLIWFGAAIITSNAKLLGYRFAILPTISFIGYCLSPLTGITIIWAFSPGFFVLKCFLAAIGFVWALMASLKLMDIDPALEDRRILASYPFILFFVLIAWTILIS